MNIIDNRGSSKKVRVETLGPRSVFEFGDDIYALMSRSNVACGMSLSTHECVEIPEGTMVTPVCVELIVREL